MAIYKLKRFAFAWNEDTYLHTLDDLKKNPDDPEALRRKKVYEKKYPNETAQARAGKRTKSTNTHGSGSGFNKGEEGYSDFYQKYRKAWDEYNHDVRQKEWDAAKKASEMPPKPKMTTKDAQKYKKFVKNYKNVSLAAAGLGAAGLAGSYIYRKHKEKQSSFSELDKSTLRKRQSDRKIENRSDEIGSIVGLGATGATGVAEFMRDDKLHNRLWESADNIQNRTDYSRNRKYANEIKEELKKGFDKFDPAKTERLRFDKILRKDYVTLDSVDRLKKYASKKGISRINSVPLRTVGVGLAAGLTAKQISKNIMKGNQASKKKKNHD